MARRSTTAKQRVASRRNLVIARRKRIRRGVAVGVGVAALAGTAITARHVYNKQFTYLYHNTTPHQARQIVKHGFSTHHTGLREGGRVFLQHGGKHAQKFAYGHGTVKVRVPKSHLRSGRGHIATDWNEFELSGMRAVSIHGRAIRKARYKISMGPTRRTSKQIRARIYPPLKDTRRWSLYD